MHPFCSRGPRAGKPRRAVFRRGNRVYRAAMHGVRPVLAVLALAVATVPAAACEPGPGYSAATNLELVASAPTIVLAQVIAGELDPGGDPFESTITIRPLEALKGALPEGDIALAGMMLARDAGPELGTLSSPYEFERAHPGSYIGACTRFVFPLGTIALFFLRIDHEGHWAPAGEAFSRWAEDVPDSDAPWVALVRLYVRAAALPEGERAALLGSARAAMLAKADDPVAQLMAADVARQQQPGEVHAQFGDEQPGAAESSVEAALRQMRKAAIEAGN
jgi:hypothetical protein